MAEDEDPELKRIRMEKIRRLLMQRAQQSKPRPKPEVIHLTSETFYKTIRENPLPLVIDCWAPWCMPCRFVDPIIKELAVEYAGKVTFAKLNTDENMELAAQLGIQGIPTILFAKNGKIINRIVGALPKHQLERYIQHFLLS